MNKQAIELFTRYGRHSIMCSIRNEVEGTCDCGFTEALAALRQPAKATEFTKANRGKKCRHIEASCVGIEQACDIIDQQAEEIERQLRKGDIEEIIPILGEEWKRAVVFPEYGERVMQLITRCREALRKGGG